MKCSSGALCAPGYMGLTCPKANSGDEPQTMRSPRGNHTITTATPHELRTELRGYPARGQQRHGRKKAPNKINKWFTKEESPADMMWVMDHPDSFCESGDEGMMGWAGDNPLRQRA